MEAMINPNHPAFVPLLLPNDRGVLDAGQRLDAVMLSAVYGVNPRLADLRSEARRSAENLLIDPKTPHFQFGGYMSMPDYRALPYSAGRAALGTLWKPETFASERSRQALIENVFAAQRNLDADLLLAPYFYVRHVDHPWLEVARQTAAEAIQMGRPSEVGVPICVDIDAILTEEHGARIADAYVSLESPFYWLVIVNYDERVADPTDANAVVAFIDHLVAGGGAVVIGYVGRTGLLAIARGAVGYAAGTHGLEAHPRQIFREMMGSAPANSYYLPECMVHVPVRVAEAMLDRTSALPDYPCRCAACEGSSKVARMVSRRLATHNLLARQAEVAWLGGIEPEERLAALRERFVAALETCTAVAAALDRSSGPHRLERGVFHYLEVLVEAAGGPAATQPGAEEMGI